MAYRVDTVGKLDGKQRTPQGGFKAPAFLTRTGVLTYRNADGSTVRELRHPDHIFDKDSLATLSQAPMVVGHPAMVDSTNWKSLVVGNVGDIVEPSGKFVAASVTVQDAETVEKVDQGQLVELSCGYFCDLVFEKGVYDGEEYEAVQTNVRYNHVGLGPSGWGRAGSDVALRLDGYTSVVSDAAKTELVIKHDTVEVDSLRAQRDAALAEVATLKVKLAEATDPKRVDGLVSERVALFDSARQVLGKDCDLTGLTPRSIMEKTVTTHDASVRCDGESDGYVKAYFEIAVKAAKAAKDSLAQVNEDSQSRTDAVEDKVESARQRMLDRNAKAWKKVS